LGDLDDPADRVLRVSTHRLRRIGAGEGRILLAEDITDLVQRRIAAQRNSRLAAMGEMAVQIVHQIRNPMGSIELFASMLKRDLTDQPENALLADKVQQGIKSLNLIIGNLLSFAKGADPDVQLVDLKELTDAALADLEASIRQRDIGVMSDFATDEKWIRVDPEWWRQALVNLMVNAVQAMGIGGSLRLTARRELLDGRGAAFKLSVIDNGAGMSPAVRERIFNPFFTTKDRGTGLGLALVFNIVKAHGGTIAVDSVEGQGADFTITIPG
jgi:signal transduction histidine kinase